MSALQQTNPALTLIGKKLANNWQVIDLIPKNPAGTGGNFSHSYNVANLVTGEKAFLKALDFSKAFKEADPVPLINKLTGLFQFEQDVLERCRNKRLSRIINLIDSGIV